MSLREYAKHMQKRRVTVTVDQADLDEANETLRQGRARSVSE